MRVFKASQARRRLSEVLNLARTEDVYVTMQNGDTFKVVFESRGISPLDVPFIKTKATTKDILDAVRESRGG
jgi:hypothetical protein